VGCTWIGRLLPHIDNVEARDLKAVGNIFCYRVWGKVIDYYLDRIFGI
jgi:hypothetical protein